MQNTSLLEPVYTVDRRHDAPRQIVLRTGGSAHGPITRLVSPSDVGELIKPFVFLDHLQAEPSRLPRFGMHPHSGIATVTVPLTGALAFEDSTGAKGVLPAGGVEWMKAGNGVWHEGSVDAKEAARGFQLWVALPAADENGPAESQYLAPADVPRQGPVRVILGKHGGAVSPVRAPSGIDYFHVELKDGERWRYQPPRGFSVAWLAVDQGRVLAPTAIESGQLAVFEETDALGIELVAEGDVSLVFGAAVKHPHPLVLGYYSVHTSAEALERGESEIRRIGQGLRAAGRI
jgi:redox-sensitive bicupin YhaK (pirin superfamily)